MGRAGARRSHGAGWRGIVRTLSPAAAMQDTRATVGASGPEHGLLPLSLPTVLGCKRFHS